MCGVLGCAISNINKNILKKDEVKWEIKFKSVLYNMNN